MRKFSIGCIKAAAEKLKDFSKEEIEAYLSDVYNVANSYKRLGPQAALDRAIQDVNKENLQNLLEDSQRIAKDAAIKSARDIKINSGVTVSQQTLRDRSGKNLDDNIE